MPLNLRKNMAINVPISYERIKKAGKKTLYSQWSVYSIAFCIYVILIEKFLKKGIKSCSFSLFVSLIFL